MYIQAYTLLENSYMHACIAKQNHTIFHPITIGISQKSFKILFYMET